MLDSRTGRELGALSPHAEILFQKNTQFKILGVRPHDPAKSLKQVMKDQFPHVVVYLRQVDNTAQGDQLNNVHDVEYVGEIEIADS
jgi:hypothetical protein